MTERLPEKTTEKLERERVKINEERKENKMPATQIRSLKVVAFLLKNKINIIGKGERLCGKKDAAG